MLTRFWHFGCQIINYNRKEDRTQNISLLSPCGHSNMSVGSLFTVTQERTFWYIALKAFKKLGRRPCPAQCLQRSFTLHRVPRLLQVIKSNIQLPPHTPTSLFDRYFWVVACKLNTRSVVEYPLLKTAWVFFVFQLCRYPLASRTTFCLILQCS